jgi:hypothetical protein
MNNICIKNSDRILYFHALSSLNEFSVSTAVLKNETFATSFASFNSYKHLGSRPSNSQATSEFYDAQTDVVFYAMFQRNAVGCWNINKPFTPLTLGIVDQSETTLVSPTDLKIGNGTVYVLSNRLPEYLFGNLEERKNIHILSGKTSEIIPEICQ